mgnify:CR=1 FL=1
MVWRRSCVSKLSANVKMGGFRLQPLRLAVPRRLLGLASLLKRLSEHHIAPFQPDVIKPEARYIKNAWGVPAALENVQSGFGDGYIVLVIAWRRLRAPRAEMSCFPLNLSERACPATARSTVAGPT